MRTLRLILGDQLNHSHSWFDTNREDVTYVLMEMRQETDYVVHHLQKVVAFFSAMRNFSEYLKENGHRVTYYHISDKANHQNIEKNIEHLISENDIEKFEYQLPDEYRLDKQLEDFCKDLKIDSEAFDTEHFLTTRTDLTEFFKGKKQMTMEYFYRDMRKKYDVMMVNNKDPEGGKWNFDKSNRKKWKGSPKIPGAFELNQDISEIKKEIEKANIKTIGSLDPKKFSWPTNRKDSVAVLNYFCENLLLHFGDYQDAMHTEQVFLFHSRLSFAMNSKMLHPMEVIQKTVDYWREHKDEIDISQIEGFIRQILGWREYMRGIYWKEMPDYKQKNGLENHNKLPEFYWTGKTKMNCLKHAINQSLEHAYAHHIQRLMITGNFALLTQTHPDQVDAWYLGIYIDAIEWVEITNTRGMSQYADGGIVATKPYISSGSYINKMSNYCSGCHYKVSKKVEEDSCPFNSLYWNFLDEKKEFFQDNHRMSMMMSLLDKKSPDEMTAIRERASSIIKNLDII